MSEPRTKTSVLERVKQSRANLEAALVRFDEAQLEDLSSADGWNLKDVMAHITFWEAYVVDRFGEVSRGEKPTRLGNLPDDELNRINHAALNAGRKKSLAEVQADFRRVHDVLLAAIEAMPEDTDHPWWAMWPDHELPWLLIEANTWDHYDEHRRNMEKWAAG